MESKKTETLTMEQILNEVLVNHRRIESELRRVEEEVRRLQAQVLEHITPEGSA